MSRDPFMDDAARGRPPDDGILLSGRPSGLIGEQWTNAVSAVRGVLADRLARGRTLARGSRVRALLVTPGIASAEVVVGETFAASIRVRTFDEPEWTIIRATLLERLSTVAALLERRLPTELMKALESRRIRLLPRPDEIEGDCSCSDFAHPCAHVAAVHAVLADALDGDPFLLLTLRGRTPEQLLGSLRRAWGDDAPVRSFEGRAEEDLSASGFDFSPIPLPNMAFSLGRAETPAVGLRALGPPPGQMEILRALTPLYEAGASAALEIAVRDQAESRGIRRIEVSPSLPPAANGRRQPSLPPSEEDSMAKIIERATAAAPPDLTERVVNVLAELGSAKSKQIADRIDQEPLIVRAELIELERLGIVYRTGQTRGTRWWLG
ncbi:MAG: hypothetical protein H0V89_07195 [Deltaproteobacteria bacterium]|nr:hypothetical protein [Deltaproteobacteria bacterium]